MLLGDYYRTWRGRLTQKGIPSPDLDLRILLGYALEMPHHKILTEKKKPLTPQEITRCDALLNRRSAREPVAYILGKKEFYSLEFTVSPDVLIPRPETELLVERAMDLAPKGGSVLEIGTGSGCISIALAHERPDLIITATDISPEALSLAEGNARALLSKNVLTFLKSDLFSSLNGITYDLILSNPPYVDLSMEPSLEPELSYEPRGALFSEGKGRFHLQQIMDQGRDFLKKGGTLIVEMGSEMGEWITEKGTAMGYRVEVYKDLSGHSRGAVLFHTG